MAARPGTISNQSKHSALESWQNRLPYRRDNMIWSPESPWQSSLRKSAVIKGSIQDSWIIPLFWWSLMRTLERWRGYESWSMDHDGTNFSFWSGNCITLSGWCFTIREREHSRPFSQLHFTSRMSRGNESTNPDRPTRGQARALALVKLAFLNSDDCVAGIATVSLAILHHSTIP